MEELTIEAIPGVGKTIAQKLREAGFVDLMSLAVSNPSELAEMCEIGEATARKIINAARNMLKMDFMTAEKYAEKLKEVRHITTSSKALDSLLGGGIETQAITEFYGAYGSGKTQMAYQLSVNVQLPEEEGGLQAACVWIDTEGTFRPKRVVQIAQARGLDPKQILRNIYVSRAFSSDHQMLLAEKIPDLINSGVKVGLIIVDSLTGLFRYEYAGRGTLAERQQKLNKHVHFLQRLADRFNLAVYVTNQVMAKPDVFFGDPTQAVGGHVVGHASTHRVYLRHSKGDKRVARLVDSPYLPEGEAVFRITEKGIEDMT